MRTGGWWARWVVLAAFTAAFAAVVANAPLWDAALRFLFPDQGRVLLPRVSLGVLVWQHVQLVLVSGALTVLVGIPLGISVTRPAGRAFLPLASNFASFGQTFPPAAVLALAVPALGFGSPATIVALFLYGLLPVVRNTIAGLEAIPADALDCADGLGMSRRSALLRVELPLAAPVILAGVRTSAVINIGTAMIGAVIGAGGLGSPIIAGLIENNVAFVLEGAIPAAFLALLADRLMANIEAGFRYPAAG